MATFDDDGLERSTRPLLRLVQQLTGLETSFITRIDWDTQLQEVLVASNTSELVVAEGSVLDWSDSMCRWAFLSGLDHTSDAPRDFPGSLGVEQLGMRTFFAVPVIDGDVTMGTVCGASRRSVDLTPELMVSMGLIADSLAHQLTVHLEGRRVLQRAEDAEELARTDSLTGLSNRRAFTVRLEEELARSGRHDSPVALLVIDVDSFKSVNDTYGHDGGDEVLVALADVLRDTVRAEDVTARLGGDEFAVVLQETDVSGAAEAAGRLAEGFRRATTALGHPATVSIGVSASTATPRRAMLAAADGALYRSKRAGRDRMEIATS